MRDKKLIRCFDNGGKTFDRYTILPHRSWRDYLESPGLWRCIAASERPYDPQGFGQHTLAMAGRHLGKRVSFDSLPEQVQRFAATEYLWDLSP